ncbi:ferredoxin [Yinghuangia sp. ASG 101]|uniref:ferredoxin n=1 Tax=Yinghuangia sp. ASG 101 TaxID=2896848 RepID=UPI001E4FD7B9|nr:ferredoxin [Yinghuangia sp. ASG 101]UGQ12701.1 ferredoxin [Yinghuangia sp. ASG 101]
MSATPETSGWTVAVDRDRCLGSGICVLYAPETFTHDDEAKAVVTGQGDPLDAVQTAIEGCPTQALQLIHDGPTTDGERG